MSVYEDDIKKIKDDTTANPISVFMRVREDVEEAHALRAAEDANNEVHGYTSRYNQIGYVDFKDRAESWKKVNDLLMNRWDARTEQVDTNLWRLAIMVSELPNKLLVDISSMIKNHYADQDNS